MNMPRYVGHNPPIAGEISREPEIGAAALIRCDVFWMMKVSTAEPVFPADNAVDRTGQAWCCGCGWRSRDAFSKDKARSRQQGRAVLERRCRGCDAKRQSERRTILKRWKRG